MLLGTTGEPVGACGMNQVVERRRRVWLSIGCCPVRLPRLPTGKVASREQALLCIHDDIVPHCAVVAFTRNHGVGAQLETRPRTDWNLRTVLAALNLPEVRIGFGLPLARVCVVRVRASVG